MNAKTLSPGDFPAFHCQPGWEAYFTKANSQGGVHEVRGTSVLDRPERSGDGGEILCLRSLGLRGKSVASMREYLGALDGVGTELTGMEPVCVVK